VPRSDQVIAVRGSAWECWLEQPNSTAFRFEDAGAGFTARRELQRGNPYWYAYRRRGGGWDEVLWALANVGMIGGVLGQLALDVARPRWIAVMGRRSPFLPIPFVIVSALFILGPSPE
jgi:hypothetical protein